MIIAKMRKLLNQCFSTFYGSWPPSRDS